jgi:hypothetical protein
MSQFQDNRRQGTASSFIYQRSTTVELLGIPGNSLLEYGRSGLTNRRSPHILSFATEKKEFEATAAKSG